jgi:galactitol-specific phosphotransferase system IIB component
MSGIINANICVFQRAYAPALLVKLDQARDRGVATIYDIDDDLQNVPESFRGPHDFYAKPEVQAGMAAFLKSVDIVTVSTEPLADQIAKTTSKPIFVVPNYLDTEMWNGALVARMQRLLTSKEPTITIGWFASGSHGMDAKMIDDVMADVMQNPNVRLAVRGGVTEGCLQ